MRIDVLNLRTPTFLFTFAAVWWTVLLLLHSSLPSHNDEPFEAAAPVVVDPFYGWQAETPDSSCSIRTCFKKTEDNQHLDCAACRDWRSQMGESPPDPGPNWVPDVTMLRRMKLDGHDSQGKPWPPSLSKEYCERIGVFGGTVDENKDLFDQVPIVVADDDDNPADGPKVFCGVYTMESAHANSIRVIRETWGPQCDGFLAFSTASDPRLPAMNIHHQGPEEYENMWQKSRAIWKFIGDHYLNDYDYFILGGDDVLIFPTNLRRYLASLKQNPAEDDLFAGRRFKGYGKDNYFNSGGSGYVLSRATLRKYVTIGYNHQDCGPNAHTSMEDVLIAECLRKVFHIGLTDTRDSQGRERFQPFSPGTHLKWEPPGEGEKDWYQDYNREWGIKLGRDCCAPDSVSFHYMKKPAMVRHLFSLLHHCPRPDDGHKNG